MLIFISVTLSKVNLKGISFFRIAFVVTASWQMLTFEKLEPNIIKCPHKYAINMTVNCSVYDS